MHLSWNFTVSLIWYFGTVVTSMAFLYLTESTMQREEFVCSLPWPLELWHTHFSWHLPSIIFCYFCKDFGMAWKRRSLLNYHFYTKTFTIWWDLQTTSPLVKDFFEELAQQRQNSLSDFSVWACTIQFIFKFWAHDPICGIDFGSWWSWARWQIWKDCISPNSSTLTFSPFSLKVILPVQLCWIEQLAPF